MAKDIEVEVGKVYKINAGEYKGRCCRVIEKYTHSAKVKLIEAGATKWQSYYVSLNRIPPTIYKIYSYRTLSEIKE